MRVFERFLFVVWICRRGFRKPKKYTAYDRFHGNGPYGKIPTKKEPIRTLGLTSRLSCHIINKYILWNNKEIKVDGKSVFYKHFFDNNIIYTTHLLYESFNAVRDARLKNSNFLVWTGLRQSVPLKLRVYVPNFEHIFDLENFKCRDYYLALINRAEGLYGRILTEVVSTDRTQWGLYTRPRSRFSHRDRLSSVNKMFIIWQKQEQFNSFQVTGLY